jgi:DNA polymerase-3 subunit gamma/tau
LKTLEEPPPHAKFVFATTEIRKVPVTILSRCQRFDLRRVEGNVLGGHLRRICNAEGVGIEDEALSMIARAAEGSVRDSLSLLDQAIAHGAGAVDADTVRTMLGLADRGRVIDLFGHLVKGDLPAALTEFRDQYDSGADPVQVLSELAEFSHFVTRLKAVPGLAEDATVSEVERRRGLEYSTLSMKVLSRFWQMLLKGIAETKDAPKPIAAAEMALVRIAYAADLPPLDEVLKTLGNGGGAGGQGGSRPAPSGGGARAQSVGLAIASRSEPVATPLTEAKLGIALARFEDLVALANEKRDIAMKIALERDVRLVRFEDGRLEFNAARGASPHLAQDLSKRLNEWTGRRWIVALSSEEGAATIKEIADAQKAETLTGVRADPLVRAVLEKFPSAEIVAVRELALEAATAAPVETDDLTDDAASFDFNLLEQDD